MRIRMQGTRVKSHFTNLYSLKASVLIGGKKERRSANTWLDVVCKQSVLPLVVRYMKLIYSWSVHPARRRRTHRITVTVRSAHSMASSSTCGSDSPPVSSACKAQRWYESQSRQLNNEGENFFPRFARRDRRYTPLCTAFRSASPTDTKLLPMALHSISTPLQHS